MEALVGAIVSLMGEVAPVARDLAQGALEAKRGRELLDKAVQNLQQQLASIDAQLRGNDAAADAAAGLLPDAAPAPRPVVQPPVEAQPTPPPPSPPQAPPVTPTPDPVVERRTP